MQRNSYICGCIKNSAMYVDRVINTMKNVGSCFNEYKIILAYDESNDHTLEKLQHHQSWFTANLITFDIIMCTNNDEIRVKNLANARNTLLNKVREYKQKDTNNEWEYMIMIDCDDVSSGNFNTAVLDKYLKRDDWDCLTFNRMPYYDIWALSFDDYVWSCWNWENKSQIVCQTMYQKITEKINSIDKDSLMPCFTAFNGFGIYRIDKFIDGSYETDMPLELWHKIDSNIIERNKKIFNDNLNLTSNSYDCEHRTFHLQAILNHNAKIMISPLFLFQQNVVQI